MVLIKNNSWNYFTGELYKSYMNQHQAEAKLVCFDKPSSPLKVHGLILAANSKWFELVLKGEYNQEVPLPYRKNIMRHLINIIYKGAVDVEPSTVPDIIKAARGLQIEGLDYNIINSNSVIKSEVPEEPHLFTSSPDHSVISQVFDIPNSTVSYVSRLVKNPFAESKVTGLLKGDNDSDKTSIGSDDEVLVIDNVVTSDIDVVLVDDGSPLRKGQSPEKPQSNGTGLSAPKIRKIESNGTKATEKRKIDGSRPVTPPSPELDVEALSPDNLCNEPQEIQNADAISRNRDDVNTGNVDKLGCLLETADRKIESLLASEIRNEIESAHFKKLTQLCVICCKHYSKFEVHKRKHKFEINWTNKYKCSKCKTSFRTQGMYSLHECKPR